MKRTLRGFPEAVHRGVPHDLGHPVGGEDLSVLFGREEAWHEGVDTNAVGSPFPREIAAQIVYRALGGRVGEDPGEGVETGNRAQVND